MKLLKVLLLSYFVLWHVILQFALLVWPTVVVVYLVFFFG